MSESTNRPNPSNAAGAGESQHEDDGERVIVVQPLPDYVRSERTLRTTKNQPLAEYFADDVRRWQSAVLDWFTARR